MEITKKLKIPSTYLFQVITQSVEADIMEQTGKEVSEKDLQGFEYIKTFSENSQATIQIEKYEKDKAYAYRTKTDKNNILATYEIKALNENSCELHYKEEITSYGYLQKVNDFFVGFIWSYLKKKRFKQMLSEIEESYQLPRN